MKTLLRISAIAACALSAPAMAATVSLVPEKDVIAPGETVVVDLNIDFTGDPTIGGGIDLGIEGPLGLVSFTPSAWFDSEPDPAFSGFGTETADADYEVHFGSFNGVGGAQPEKVGEFVLEGLEPGTGVLRLAINTTWGDFFNIESELQDVTFEGATIEVVPVPAAVWLFASGLGLLAARSRRRS